MKLCLLQYIDENIIVIELKRRIRNEKNIIVTIKLYYFIEIAVNCSNLQLSKHGENADGVH